MPGKVVEATVVDIANGVISCEITPFSGISSTIFVVQDYLKAMFVQSFLDGNPAVIRLNSDDAMENFFKRDNLNPKFSRKTLRYEYGLPQITLDAWVEVGVLSKTKVDWHYACPDCDTMITVREGCYGCLATNDRKPNLLRHNKCGYIGFGKQFDEWKCPHCKEALTITQGDFDMVYGPARCEICGHLDVPTKVAGCLGCNNFFPLTTAKKMEVFNYSKKIPILT